MRYTRILWAALAALLFATPASATNLLTATITTAGAGVVGTAVQFMPGSPPNLSIQCNFTYGSGGTSADFYVQTSLDGGSTWTDVAECGFTTASARKIYNVSTNTGGTAALTATDGSLTANTAIAQGVLGPRLRVKYTTVGTYAGNTTIKVDVQSNAGRVQP